MGTISSQTVNWAHENQWRHWYKDEVTSTNTIAKDEFNVIEEFKLYIANTQSLGRGRGENKWENTKEKNSLLSSWAYKINFTPQHFLPALIGLAVFKSCQNVWKGLSWSIKAPNDIFIEDKKVAGLLTEVVQQGDDALVIIGLGFNVFSAPENMDRASFLVNFLGEKKSFSEEQWLEFLSELKKNFDEAIKNCEQLKINEKDRELLLESLNTNPWKKEVYLEVTDQGDLITETETKSWRDL